MGVVTVPADAGIVRYVSPPGEYGVYWGFSWVGDGSDKGQIELARQLAKSALDKLPARRLPKNIRIRFYVTGDGGVNHYLDIHPYNNDGQADPATDPGPTAWNRCDPTNIYVMGSDAFRSTGEKWFDLGSSAPQHVKDAKEAVNRYTVATHEWGDDDPAAVCSLDIRLEITYPTGGLPANRALIPMGLM